MRFFLPLPPAPPSPFSVLPPPRVVMRKLHPFLLRPAKFVPFDVQRSVLERLMRAVFNESFLVGDLDFLKGRWLQLEVTDLRLVWYITLGTQGPIVAAGPVEADVIVKGSLKEFVSLANQNEDPDTLFFNRRLSIEGDTELGLYIKNLLYSTELKDLSQLMAQAMQYYFNLIEQD